MKHIYIILCLIVCVLFVACSKEDSNLITIAVNNTSSSGSDTTSTSGTTGDTTPSTPGSPSTPETGGLPVSLMGVPPEEKTVSVTTTVTSGASEAIIALYGYDFDNTNEGQLCINGNTNCITLFGVDNDSNNSAYATIQYVVPASWLITGDNSFTFTHTATGGYRVETISITYQ